MGYISHIHLYTESRKAIKKKIKNIEEELKILIEFGYETAQEQNGYLMNLI